MSFVYFHFKIGPGIQSVASWFIQEKMEISDIYTDNNSCQLMAIKVIEIPKQSMRHQGINLVGEKRIQYDKCDVVLLNSLVLIKQTVSENFFWENKLRPERVKGITYIFNISKIFMLSLCYSAI